MMTRWLPRTIAARLYLILFAGLLIAHGLSFSFLLYERYEAANAMLLTNIEQDVDAAVALLDRMPAAERSAWLPRLKRRTYSYILGRGVVNNEPLNDRGEEMTQLIASSLGEMYSIQANTVSHQPYRFHVHTTLSDGSPLTIEVTPSVMPVAKWLPVVL